MIPGGGRQTIAALDFRGLWPGILWRSWMFELGGDGEADVAIAPFVFTWLKPQPQPTRGTVDQGPVKLLLNLNRARVIS